jgi:hypothetical protein
MLRANWHRQGTVRLLQLLLLPVQMRLQLLIAWESAPLWVRKLVTNLQQQQQ